MVDPLPSDIFRKGQVLNHTYEVEGVLGRGGTGEVYRAHNQITGRTVAIKALNRALSANDAYLELMRREEEMRAISSDAVVRYTDCSRSVEGHVYLVMDYVDGTPLSDWLARGGANARDLMIVARRVAEGLVATHAKKIVHRDLSPDNIVLRGDDPAGAMIIDFGIAKDTSVGARTIVGNDFAGKYEYAAPEQMHGRAEPRSDLYALGASLLATFRGRVPELGGGFGTVAARKEKPLDTAGVPEPLKGLIDALAAPDPARRPPSAAAVVEMIDGMLREQPPKLTGGRGRRAPVRTAATVAVLVGAVAAGAWWSGWPDEPPLPLAEPYMLTASRDAAGGALLGGNAPDEAQRAALAQGFEAAAGQPAPEGAITLAAGEPVEDWSGAIVPLLEAAAPLPQWSVEVEDRAANLSGVAVEEATASSVRQAFEAAAIAAGLAPSVSITMRLSMNAVAELVDDYETCGPLDASGDIDGAFASGTEVRVAGYVADEADLTVIRRALEAEIGGGSANTSGIKVLWAGVCALLSLLPAEQDENLQIALGDPGASNLTGRYAVGDTVKAIVQVPAAAQGNLWVVLADPNGALVNLLPRDDFPETDLAANGTTGEGRRRIPVLPWMGLELEMDKNPGKYALLALLTDAPLLPSAGAAGTTLDAFEDALQRALETGSVDVRAWYLQIVEAR